MKPFLALALALAAASAGVATAQSVVVRPLVREDGRWLRVERGQRFELEPDLVSVRLRAGVAGLEALRVAPGAPAFERLRSNELGVHDLRLTDGVDLVQALEALRASGLVEFAEECPIGRWLGEPDDPRFPDQWALRNTGQSGGTPGVDLGALEAWSITTGDPSVVIAVVDSGVDIASAELAPNVWVNPGEVPGNGLDDDGNGYVDDVHGWDFFNGDADPTGPSAHGTFVAGVTSAATSNGQGVAGLAGGYGAPGRGCRMMPLGIGDTAPIGAVIDDAILYAARNGARVITMSLEVPQTNAIDAALAFAWNAKGLFVDCASGNQGGPVNYPATSPHVVCVGASDRLDLVPTWSNAGPEMWLAAPGVSIVTTSFNGNTIEVTGTSFAAPYVGAAAALVYSVLPATSNETVKQLLAATAVDLGAPGFDEGSGWGRLDVAAALLEASRRDCNQNGVYDPEDIAAGSSLDADGDGLPDECGCVAPSAYCVAAPNSVGAGAQLGWSGSASVALDELVLEASGLPPGRLAVFFRGADAVQSPFGDGFRCVGGELLRLAAVQSSGAGGASHALALDRPPAPGARVLPGDTWRFQVWYEDPAGGPAGFNLSNGVEASFCP